MTFSEAAVEVLRLVGRPMHFKKITQVAIAKNLLSHVGKTPDVTMSARLAAVVGKDRGDVPIVRTKAGVFGLREWGDTPPNGPDVGENDSFTIPGEPAPEPKAKKARAKGKEAKEEGKRRGKDGKDERRGRRGRKEAAAPTEEVSPAAAEDEPKGEPERAERDSLPRSEWGGRGGRRPTRWDDGLEARPTEPEPAQPAADGDGAGLGAVAESLTEDSTPEDEAELEETAELPGPNEPIAEQGAAPRPAEVVAPEGGGRRRRRRRRRRGGDRAEAGPSQGPIVEVRSRNGGGVPRVIPGGLTSLDGGAEERADTTGSGSYPVFGAGPAPAAGPASGAQPEPDEADLVGEVMAEREEERERVPRPAQAAERRDFPRREVVTRAEPTPAGEQTLADGAYRLLVGQERTGGVPIRQLAEQAQRAGLIGADSPAPWMVIGAAMRSENQRRALSGSRPRFRALSGSRWALFEWGVGGEALRLEAEAAQLAEKQREASKRTLIRRLVDMGDPQFEHIILLLCDRLGYERPRRVPNRGGGRELHLAATSKLGPGGVVTALVFTRAGREVDAARVSELRGALHHYGATMGWILTTGSVAGTARDEAAAPGAPPIGLTDSAGLGRLFDETGVGLCKARLDLAYLDVELLDALKNG